MRIGTRSSAMAIAQTETIAAQLSMAAPQLSLEIVKFKPRGDIDQRSKLDRHGGKGGAFVAEIREAMRKGKLESAMHSLKDAPGDEEAPGLVFAAFLKREAIEDVLVLRSDHSIDDIKKTSGAGFKIGTNSVRRATYAKRLLPGSEVIHYRGAADTRIRKLDERIMQKLPDGGEVGPADALIMARSGLVRLGLESRISMVFSSDEMLPAIGQGIVAVECAETDWKTRANFALINHEETKVCALAERETLWVLNGHCNTPIAGHASFEKSALHLKAAVLGLNGENIIEASGVGDPARPRELGRAIGLELLEQGAATLIESSR